MSDVLDRLRTPSASRSTTRPSATRRSAASLNPTVQLWARGAFAAAWSVTVGLASLIVLALIVWAADSQSTASAGAAMRLASQMWLLAQRTPMHVHGGTLSIPPLTLTFLVGLLVARASLLVARHSGSSDLRAVGTIAGTVALPYAALAGVVAALSTTATFDPSVGAACVCAFLVGGVSAAIGAARGAGVTRATWQELSVELRSAGEAAGAAALVLLAGATLLTVGSLLVHARQIGSMTGAFSSGSGKFAVLLISLLYLPNAIVFTAIYIAGPGFAIGTGSSVTVGTVHLGAMPALPLLAATPSTPAGWLVVGFCAVVILGSGLAAGWRIVHRLGGADGLRLGEQVRYAALSGVIVGIGAAVLTAIAGGPSGPGQLRAVGPSPWQAGLSVAGETAVLATVTVLVFAWTGSSRFKRKTSPDLSES